jgi:hypothetical protein
LNWDRQVRKSRCSPGRPCWNRKLLLWGKSSKRKRSRIFR